MWRRRAIWALLLVLSLVGISFYGGAVSYGFLAGVMLVPLLSWIYLIAVFLRFKVYQELESRNIVCGQATGYYFVLKNEDFFAFSGVSVRMFSDFSYVHGICEDVEYQLLPGEDYQYETRMVCKYRGEYEVGIREIILTDFLRLFRLRYQVPEKKKAVVLPRLVSLAQLRSLAALNVMVQREAQDGNKYPDIPVREYVPGDSMKQIHWKTTARMQKLMVRLQTGEKKHGVTVFLVTKRYGKTPKEYLPLENKLLEVTLALGYYFVRERTPVSLYYGQGGLRRRTADTLEDFEAFYQSTAGIAFEKEENPLETILLASPSMAESRIAFFVVHEMQEEYLALEKTLRQGGTTAFFYVVSDVLPEEYFCLPELGGKLFFVSTDAELEEVL